MTEVGQIALDDVARALRQTWDVDTCAPEDRPDWTAANPARGQCITTVLIVHDYCGGNLIRGEVLVDGEQVDHHWWNRLPDGTEVDLTREQFDENELIVGSVEVVRPTDAGRVASQYLELSDRVRRNLAELDRH